MRFDDRLSTVLRKPATGEAIARIQYRQLLDLLGTSLGDTRVEVIDAAYLRLAQLSARIPAHERAAMLREPMLRLRNPRLVAQLAEAEPMVASAALFAARLGEDQWLDLIPALPIRTRGMVRHSRDLTPRIEALLCRLGITERGLPPPPAAAAEEPIEGIGAIVRRIEEFRRTRQQQDDETAFGDAPRLPLDDPEEVTRASRHLETFDFATDAEGRIVWSDPAAAPMSVGLRLGRLETDSAVQSSRGLAGAFRHRQPVRDELVQIAGAPAIAGSWQVDAAPRFEQPGGRFIGYCGRMRRPLAEAAAPTIAPESADEFDRMRQILHELRTPVNAIQGFAEVIQQQLFGPTPHEYRALAATIASDSAHMLAGFDELDRLVKLDAGALELAEGECDLAAIIAMTVAQLEPYTAARSSGFVVEDLQDALPVAMARADAEQLVWRLLATLAGAAAPGEVLKLKLRPREGMARLVLRLPAALAAHDETRLFDSTITPQPQQPLSAGMFGAGFALRLAAAEADAAGGLLVLRDEKLRLSLPMPARDAVAEDSALEARASLRGNS